MKHGLKLLFRFPVRSSLFFVLIAAASLFLSLGISILMSARAMLIEADARYITAGTVVFKGGHYPDASAHDPALAAARSAFDITALADLPGVRLVEENREHRAYLPDLRAINRDVPYNGFAIVEAQAVVKMEGMDFVSGNIQDVIYQAEDKLAGSILILPPYGEDANYPYRHTYLFVGNAQMIQGHSNQGLQPRSYADLVAASGGPRKAYPVEHDITDDSEAQRAAFWSGETGQYYTKLARMMDVINHSVGLVATRNIRAVEPFHRGAYVLREGDFFTPKDEAAGDVCLLPQKLARDLGVSVGDSVALNIHRQAGDQGIYASYWPDVGFAATDSFRVVGVYDASEANPPIYIPDAGQGYLSHGASDYTLGRVVLENGARDAFLKMAAPLLPQGVTLSFHDQGYEDAFRSISGMREAAALITAVSGAVCLLILVFFGYLFVSRNAPSAAILMGLGAGARRVWLFYATGVGVLASLAAGVGAAVAYLLADRWTQLIYASIQIPDRRFAISGMGLKAVAPQPSVTGWPFALSVALVVIAALAICSLFVYVTLMRQNPRNRFRWQARRIRRARVQAGATPRKAYRPVGSRLASILPGTPLRYAVKALLRGGARSLVTVVVFVVLVCSMGMMDGLLAQYERSLDRAYDDNPVTVHFTDLQGRLIDNLGIDPASVRALEAFDFISESWYSRNGRYHLAGKATGAAAQAEPDWLEHPAYGTFAYETFLEQLNIRFPAAVLSNAPAYTEGYFYADPPVIAWAEGYDQQAYQDSFAWKTEGGMRFPHGDGNPAVLATESFLRENDLAPGDSIYLEYLRLGDHSDIMVMRFVSPIAGVISGGVSPDTIYLPSSLIAPHDRYNAAGGRVSDTRSLERVRDGLARQFAEVNHRTRQPNWIIMDDVALQQAVENLTRHIEYMRTLYPVLLAVSVGLGFLIANLSLRGRRKEIALLRSVGASKPSVFLSLFGEQVLLCVPGLLLGVLGMLGMLGGMQMSIERLGLFAGIYLLGAAAAIVQTQRVALMKNLMTGE